MVKKLEMERAARRRKPEPQKVSSGARGSAIADVLQHFETTAPLEARKTGLTSAGMRAGAIVRGMRRSAQLTQAQLARKLHVTQERVSEIELGQGPQGPTFELLERIAAACGMVIVPIERDRADVIEASAALIQRDDA